MFFGEVENVRNEKAVGLSSQRDECGRRRVLEEESGTGVEPLGPPHETSDRKAGRSVAPPQ